MTWAFVTVCAVAGALAVPMGSGSSGAGLHVVTGAFGYSGKYITSRLLSTGKRARTLTNSLQRENRFRTAVEAHPDNFDRPDELEWRRWV